MWWANPSMGISSWLVPMGCMAPLVTLSSPPSWVPSARTIGTEGCAQTTSKTLITATAIWKYLGALAVANRCPANIAVCAFCLCVFPPGAGTFEHLQTQRNNERQGSRTPLTGLQKKPGLLMLSSSLWNTENGIKGFAFHDHNSELMYI